jgi:hypothetical protein
LVLEVKKGRRLPKRRTEKMERANRRKVVMVRQTKAGQVNWSDRFEHV